MVATVTDIGSAGSTVHYFEQDGYYAKGDPEHRKASFWHGELARALGLGRHVSPKRFNAILQGYVPGTDIRLGRLRDGGHQHRPGVDITLSAPKSVSLAALLHGDRRVIRAHDEAVRAALDRVEAELLQTRGWDPETRRRPRVKAHGMIAATFRHLASRNLDPQLHTHCVVANMTRNGAGEWRSIEATAIRRNKKLIGAHYRNELARRLEALGYGIAPAMIGPVPGFELEGYDREMRDAFSTRRRDILEDIRRRGGAYSAARAQQAALYTRRRKAEPAMDELRRIWRRRAREAGLVSREAAPDRGPGQALRARRSLRAERQAEARPALPVHEAVWQAVAHLEERSSVFAAGDIAAHALGQAPGRYSLREVEAAVEGLRRDGHLVQATLRGTDRAFVTDRALRAERGNIAWMREGAGAGAPAADEVAVERELAAGPLTEGQREAVRTILLTQDRVVGVQGHAGTGKTVMLRETARLAGARKVVGLAPSMAAVRALEREAGIPARTLQWFLARHRDIGDRIASPERLAEARLAFGGAVLAVDEASMVSSAQMRQLMRISERIGIARLALVGDSGQLRSVEAGQPFRQLQQAGMATARMDEVLRQRDPDLREAIAAIREGEPAEAVERLGDDVHEAEPDELGEAAARLWLSLHPEARARTAILAPTHALREDIDEAVREGLRDEGALHGRVLEIDRLVGLGLTRAQKADVANYRPGDVLVFHNDIHQYRVKADDACTVTGAEDGRVLLEHPDGRPRRIDPSKPVRYRYEAYETRPIRLQAGDRIRWTRNDRKRGLVNGDEAEVLAVGSRLVKIGMEDGRSLSLRREDPQLRHIDHAWSATLHAAQGTTRDNAIVVLDSGHGLPVDRAAFYVGISRARDNAVVLTDNREDLVEALEAHAGAAMTALEAVGEEIAPAAPLPIPAREALWPELSTWRALEEEARRQGTIPFYMEGCADAVERLAELGRTPGISGAVAAAAERVAGAYAAAGEARAALDRLHEALAAGIDGRAGLTGRTGDRAREYGPWHKAAQQLLSAADGAAAGEERRRPHLDARPAVRDGIVEAREVLRGILDADAAVLPVLGEWRDLERRAAEAGRHWYREHGRAYVLGRMDDLPALPHMDAALRNGMAAIVAEGRGIAAAEERFGPLAARLRDCVEERERLIAETGENRATFSLHPALEAWREEAAGLLEEAKSRLDANGSFTHADALPDLRDGIAEDRKLLEGAVSLDRRHAACLQERLKLVRRDTGTPLFYREGNDAVVLDMRLLAAEPGLDAGARALLERLVAQHDAAAAAKAEVENLVVELRFSLDLRRQLSDLAAERRRSVTEEGTGYRAWADEAARLCGRAERVLAERRYAPHLDRIEGARDDIGRDSGRLGQALETDAAWTAFAPRLGNSGLSAPELRQVVEEAKRMLDRPELDPGARRKLEIHVRVRDPARQHGLYRDIGPGGGISM